MTRSLTQFDKEGAMIGIIIFSSKLAWLKKPTVGKARSFFTHRLEGDFFRFLVLTRKRIQATTS